MHIPRYWAKESQGVGREDGGPFLAQCWRWSDTSQQDARDRARAALKEIVRGIGNNERPDRYAYGERPLREEIVRSITHGADGPAAVITRNAYGALILNTARVMFVDIDFVPEGLAEKLQALLRRLLGRPPGLTQEEARVQQLHHWLEAHPGWGMRVYRTKAGLRCLVTHDTYDPALDSTSELLASLGADPLYTRLCRNQESYRARLTPKPWRCGLKNPPNRYPWESERAEQLFRRWEAGYERAISGFTTCKLITETNRHRPHPEARVIQNLHDHYACANDRLPLA